MINDLVVINNSMALSFQNEKLNESVRRIQAYARNAKVAYLQIAFELKVIKDNELYKEDGYTSIVEFAERVLNCSKSTTNRMIQVADSFLVNEGTVIKSVFAQGEEDFSFNQLRETLSLRRQEIEKLVSSGRLLPSMTVKEIRTVVQEEKNKEEKSDDILDISSSSSIIGTSESVEQTNLPIIQSENLPVSESIESSLASETISFNETPLQAAQNAPESLSDSSLVSEYQNSSEKPVEGSRTSQNSLSEGSYQPISNNDIDFMIAQLTGDEESKEEYSSAPYEFNFFNCKKEVSESKRIDDIELDELVYSDIVGRLPSELKNCFELLKKEVKRLNYFRTIESEQLNEEIRELKEKVKRLSEENYRLLHPEPKRRGRPRKER